MSESTQQTVEKSTRRGPRRTLAWAGGALVIVLVAAGIAVPQIVHAQHVEEYSALVHERDTAVVDRAEAQATLDGAMGLALAQQGETRALAARMTALGQTPAPILTAEQTQALTAAGAAVAEVVGEETDAEPSRARAHETLVAAVDALRTDDEAARTVAAEAGDDMPEPTAPSSYLALSVDQATALVGAERTPVDAEIIADADVTPEVIEAVQAEVAEIEADTGELLELIHAEQARMAEFGAAIQAALPALHTVAEGAETQASEIAAQTAKAPDASGVAVAAAQQVMELTRTDDAERLLTGLAAYVEAATKAQTDHAAVVQREKEQAEAAARAEASRRQTSIGSGGGGGGNGKKSRLCSRYRPSPGGGGSLVLVYC